jgi:hypothetical protein
MNLDQYLVVRDGRLLHLSDPNHLRRAVSGMDRRLHTGTVATAPHRTATSLIRESGRRSANRHPGTAGMPSRRRLERDRRPGRGGSAEEPLHAARMAEAATDSRLAARREPRRGTRFGCCRYWPSARTRSPVRSSRLSPNRQAPPMVMWTLPPSLLRTQRRPKRPLPHRLLTHHRLPSPTLVLQSVPGRSNQPGGHTDDSGLFRVPPNRFQDPMDHTPNAPPDVTRVGLTAPSACTPSGGCDDEPPQAHSGFRV